MFSLFVVKRRSGRVASASLCGENKGEKKAQYARERAVEHYEEAVADEENYADEVAQREYEQAVAMGVPQAPAATLTNQSRIESGGRKGTHK